MMKKALLIGTFGVFVVTVSPAYSQTNSSQCGLPQILSFNSDLDELLQPEAKEGSECVETWEKKLISDGLLIAEQYRNPVKAVNFNYLIGTWELAGVKGFALDATRSEVYEWVIDGFETLRVDGPGLMLRKDGNKFKKIPYFDTVGLGWDETYATFNNFRMYDRSNIEPAMSYTTRLEGGSTAKSTNVVFAISPCRRYVPSVSVLENMSQTYSRDCMYVSIVREEVSDEEFDPFDPASEPKWQTQDFIFFRQPVQVGER